MTSLELMGVSVDAPRSVVRDLTVTLGTRDNEVRLAVLLGPADFDGAPLARILVGTAACAEGRITLAGQDVTAQPPGRRDIALVPAGGGMLPHLTIRENISYGVRLRGSGRVTRHDEDLLDDLAKGLGIAEDLDRRPADCAVEESLRAGLARALMRLPSVVVIDATGRNAEAEVIAESGDAEPAACRLAGYVLDRWPHTGVLVLTGDEAVAAWARGRAGRVVRMDGTGQCLVDADPTGKGAG